MLSTLRSALAALLLLLAPGAAAGAGALGDDGDPLLTSDYGIDLFEGPVLSSCRVSGLAGAYAGLAEGVDANPINAAAPALRRPWSYDWFDYDLSLGVTFPGALSETDFDNNGSSGFVHDDFLFLTLGANLQFGWWALGVSLDTRSFQVGVRTRAVTAELSRMHLLLARGFWRGQLMLGLGARVASFALATGDGTGDERNVPIFSVSGVGAEAGAIWAPHALPLRVGVTLRQPIKNQVHPENQAAPDENGDVVVKLLSGGEERGYYLPLRVEQPWELELGVAVELIGRRLNPAWRNPGEELAPFKRQVRDEQTERLTEQGTREDVLRRAVKRTVELRLEEEKERLRAKMREGHESAPRRRLLLSASLLVTGAARGAVGLESFFEQRVERSGEKATLTPRLGLEAEPLSGWLQLRVGAYLEPSRYRDRDPRLHATTGFDLKVLPWSVFGLYPDGTWWALGAFGDLARGYYATGLRIGVWR